MGTVSHLRYLYLAYFSKPAADRVVYRDVRRRQVAKILQIGLDSVERSLRMIAVAKTRCESNRIRFAAVDLFEARPKDQPGLALKDAHRLLRQTGAGVQLIPGDPHSALARAANSLGQVDLVLISAGYDEQSLAGAWFYVPRLLHVATRVYLEARTTEGGVSLRPIERERVEALAAAHRPRRVA